MRNKFGTKDKVSVTLDAEAYMNSGVTLRGKFKVNCYGPDGELKWTDINHNTVMNEGIDNMLNVYFHGTTASGTFYVGLKGAGAEAVGDTLLSHAGWSEITAYSGNRKEFVENAASGQAIDNTGNVASFAINGDATVAGAFLCSAEVGTAGTLFCAEDFTSSRTVANGDKSCCRKTSLKTVKPKGTMSLWQRCAKLTGNRNERPETDITLRSMTMGSCEANA